MISQKNILITGGSSGIGKHLAASFLKSGNKVVIASNDQAELHNAVNELRVISPNIFSCMVDVNKTNSVSRMSRSVVLDHGCPDMLINCAGFATYRTFEETPMEEIEELVGVNLLGAMRCTRVFLPDMIARRSGYIVNIASIAGKLVMTPNGVYSASKHGLVSWSETLKYELSRFDINVSVICPGRVIETAFFDHETFRSRAPRAETTMLTVPIAEVSRKTLEAIEKKKFLTFIPSYYGFLIWLINTFSYFSKPVYGKLLSSRIESLYTSKVNLQEK